MKNIVGSVMLFLAILTNLPAQVPAATIPEFNFFKLNKSLFTNKNLASGKMIFFVFFDTDCDHCQHAIQYINQHSEEFKKAAVYLITLDDQEKITLFMGKYGNNLKGNKNITILQDLKNEFLPKFRPRKYPSLFLYSAKKELIMYDDNPQNLFRFTQQINKAVK
ncbi:MAG: TlpA family protein disulfide reductase [Chitinophagaceae bacterium]